MSGTTKEIRDPRSEIRDSCAAALAEMAGVPASAAADMAAAAKDLTLGQYARLWEAGMEGSLSAGGLNEPMRPYQQSQWVYKCVKALYTTGAGIPLRLSTETDGLKYHAKSYRAAIRRSRKHSLRPMPGCKSVCVGGVGGVGKAADGELVEAGEAWELLNRPNSYQDWPQFFSALIGYFYARGKVALVMTDMVGNSPGEMHVIDGKHIKPVWARDDNDMPVLLGYKYRAPKSGKEIPLSTDEVKYWALWDDSDDPLGGMAPSLPGRLAIATDYNASLFNASALSNGCDIGIHVDFPQALTPEQQEQYRTTLRQRHQGAARAARPLITEGGAKVSELSGAAKDMAWDKLKGMTRIEICALYDVPPVVAGWVEAAGDSSAYTENALKQFYQQAIFPMLDFFAPALQELVSRFDVRLVLWFDVEDQPVVQKMRLSRIESGDKLVKWGVPVEDINDLLDLGLPDRPQHRVGFIPVGMQPVADAMTPLPPLDEGASADDSDELDQTAEQRNVECRMPNVELNAVEKAAAERIWRAWHASFTPLSKRLARLLITNYSAQERWIVKLLKDKLPAAEDAKDSEGVVVKSNKTTSASPETSAAIKSETIIAEILVDVFDNAEELRKFRARLAPGVGDAYELGVRQAASEAGLTGDAAKTLVDNVTGGSHVRAAMQSDTITIAAKTNAFTRQHLRKSLVDGLGNNESINELADRVQTFMGNRRKSALVQARNAVGQSLSRARHTGHVAAGMTHKSWIYSRGPGDRREAHIAAEATYAKKPIPMSQPFVINGAHLMYPRDTAGPPGEIINCACLKLAMRVNPKSEITNPKFADLAQPLLARGFVTYAGMLAQRANEQLPMPNDQTREKDNA